MRRGRGHPKWSAALTPGGVYAVAYRSTPRGMEVDDYAEAVGPLRSGAEAGRAVADALQARGGRGGRVSLAVSGFGAYAHFLTLPAAQRDLLLPVVGREMRRFFPDLFQADEPPIIDYREVGAGGSGPAGNQRELLAAAVPRGLIRAVTGELENADLEVEHWTVLPRAVQRLYDAFDGGTDPTAAVVLAPGSSLLGLFYEGELRLFSDWTATGSEEPSELTERMERGALYLRQQFRGALLSRVLLAAEPGREAERVREAVRGTVEVAPQPFGRHGEHPGAMLAMGAALDAAADDGLDLRPHEGRAAAAPDRWSRTLAVASLLLVVLAGGWWTWSAARAEARAEARLEAARESLSRRDGQLGSVMPVLEARQSHAQRAELLRLLVSSRERLPDLLWPIATTSERIQLRSLRLEPAPDGGWTGVLEATASGWSAAEVTGALDGLYQRLLEELPNARVSVEQMSSPAAVEGADAGSADFAEPIAIAFRMSFIVPAVEEAPS